jgi:hypothetical protein
MLQLHAIQSMRWVRSSPRDDDYMDMVGWKPFHGDRKMGG